MIVITVNVNNGRLLRFYQDKPDGAILIDAGRERDGYRAEYVGYISPGDAVMLYNLYRHIKDNDIQNDFINPEGKNRE